MQNQAERDVLEYLIQFGLLNDDVEAIAQQVLDGQVPLSAAQEATFQSEIADGFFHVECEKCCRAIPLEDVPGVIESGDEICRQCQPVGSFPTVTILGERAFVDGAVRKVFRDGDGRTFVLDGDGDRLYGNWLELRA